jgi:hypothetical protein
VFDFLNERNKTKNKSMDITDDMDFDQWFDIFTDCVRKLGHKGPIDKYAFEWDYEDGKTPEYSAEEWMKEMKS